MKFLINLNRFNETADFLLRPFFVILFLLLVIGLLFSFYLSPNDYHQGTNVRIMYIPVPSAWLALMTYVIMTIYILLIHPSMKTKIFLSN